MVAEMTPPNDNDPIIAGFENAEIHTPANPDKPPPHPKSAIDENYLAEQIARKVEPSFRWDIQKQQWYLWEGQYWAIDFYHGLLNSIRADFKQSNATSRTINV